MFKVILLLGLLACIATAQDNSKVLGIGYGTFTIILSIILWIVVCIATRSTQHPELYSLIAGILPLFFILFFVFMPRNSSKASAAAATDTNFVPHVIFVILFFLMFITAALLWLIDIVFVYKRARSIARAGVVTISLEEQRSRLAEGQRGNGQNQEAHSQNALLADREEEA